MNNTRPIAPQHPRRTCHELGICLHPTTACGDTCQQHTGGPTMQRLMTTSNATNGAASPATELPTPTLPFEVEGPYRRQSSHRRNGLNRTERLAFWLMVVTSMLTGCALLYVLYLALISAGGFVGDWLKHTVGGFGMAAAVSATPATEWKQALEGAIKTNPRGKAGVAEQLGVSRGYVSQVMNGHRPVAPPEFVVRVVERLCVIACPHLGKTIDPAACRTYANRQWEAISQFEVDHWRACQHCETKAPPAMATPLKPKPEDWVFVPRPARTRQRTQHHAAPQHATASASAGVAP